MTILLDLLKFFSVGVLGGMVSGLIGIGGGVIMLPILLYIMNVETKAATAMSMIQVFFASISGTIFHYLHKTIKTNYAICFGLSSMPFSFLGSFLTKYINNLAIKIVYIIATITILVLFLIRYNNSQEECIFNKKRLFIIIPIGAVAGFIGGLLGLGGGFLFVPILVCLFNFPLKIAVGTSLFSVFFNSIPGVIGKLISVKFNIYLALVLGIGAICGSSLGTYLNKKLSHKIIKVLFIIILIIAISRVTFDLLIGFIH